MARKGKEPKGLRAWRLKHRKKKTAGKKRTHKRKKRTAGKKHRRVHHHAHGPKTISRRKHTRKRKRTAGRKRHMKWGSVKTHRRRVAGKKHKRRKSHRTRGIGRCGALMGTKHGSFLEVHNSGKLF